jgi:hypothetical protein
MVKGKGKDRETYLLTVDLCEFWQTKDGSGDVPFPPVKDSTQFSIAHAKSSKVS